ncbi:RING-type E3 ubiquitin transferase [Sarracenia purpurea var. burkii]
MGDSSELNRTVNDSAAIELTGKIMVVAIIVLFFVVAFVIFLHLYAKWFWYRQDEESVAATNNRRRRRRFDFAPAHPQSSVASGLRRGLDATVLKSLSIVIFNTKDFTDGLECAVCLSQLADGEKTRLLPKCNHGFHVDCIDMWFQSHSTCPICRHPVSTQSSATLELIFLSPHVENPDSGANSTTESPNFPTNVLFCGNQTQISTLGSYVEEDRHSPADTSSQPPCSSSSSSSSPSINNRPDGMLVIDIPRPISEDEDPKSPMTTRLRSLKRLLSRDRRMSWKNPSSLTEDVLGKFCT